MPGRFIPPAAFSICAHEDVIWSATVIIDRWEYHDGFVVSSCGRSAVSFWRGGQHSKSLLPIRWTPEGRKAINISTRDITMFIKTEIALSAVISLDVASPASAATSLASPMLSGRRSITWPLTTTPLASLRRRSLRRRIGSGFSRSANDLKQECGRRTGVGD